MKKYFPLLILFCFLIQGTSTAQVNAVTEHGDSVVLKDNGRWLFLKDYHEELTTPAAPINTNSSPFTKAATATTEKKGKDNKYTTFYDDKTWASIDPALINPQADLAFNSVDGKDGYGMIIFEGVEVPLVQIKDIAISNAERVGDDVKVLKEEYRTVNGSKVLMMSMTATVSGMDLQYYYYFGNVPEGTIQYIVFTTRLLASSMEESLMELLNGLVLKP